MITCINCGVELEENMQRCPLCGTAVGGDQSLPPKEQTAFATKKINQEEKHLLQRILWQVTSILLLSGIISTLVINLVILKKITWSVYPVTVCMIVFSYASLFAFWHTRRIYQMVTGFLIASILFVLLHFLLPDENWPLQVGLPLLGAINLIAIILIFFINLTKYRGLNVIAYTSVAIAALCMSIEGILSLYKNNLIMLRWSVIVAMCLLPVTAALLFMHNRTRKNPETEKIFHT